MNGTGDGSDNKSEIKVIVRTLAVCLAICIVGIFALVYTEKRIPTELWLLTSNLATALTAMLVKTSPTSSPTNEIKSSGPVKVPEQVLETKI